MTTVRELAKLYRSAHNFMRNIDGLQPQEAFDELLKYLFVKQKIEAENHNIAFSSEELRAKLKTYLDSDEQQNWTAWSNREFSLSDTCLERINELLQPVNFSQLNYDIRSHAIKEFLTPDIRKGLGIFLTPDDVVKFIIDYISPKDGALVADPACGSGTFLIEALKHAQSKGKKVALVGKDKNPRMIALAELNLEHQPTVSFKAQLIDSIRDKERAAYDVVVTNPPFGVSLDSRSYEFENYLCCLDENGTPLTKQSSEMVFIEHSLDLLKPGGTLGIVIPKSIATNNSLQKAREALSSKGYIYSVVSLPSETFATTGTQTTTIVLFIRKYKDLNERAESIDIKMANISNVGFDSTGRDREGNQLPDLAKNLNQITDNARFHEQFSLIDNLCKSETFSKLSEFFISSESLRQGIQLAEICEVITTGRTPARSAYCEEGNFLIKVGNLSGSGINWEARDRNFISDEELAKREKGRKSLILQEFDILLTSSAHSPVYIAKKSDIFLGAPSYIRDKISFVGEVMLVRADKSKIDPFMLLAFLRDPRTVQRIQNMVRGQTAHLHPSDLGKLIIPNECLEHGSKYQIVGEIIKEQAELSEKINSLNSRQYKLLAEI